MPFLSKRVLVLNHSYGDETNLHVNAVTDPEGEGRGMFCLPCRLFALLQLLFYSKSLDPGPLGPSCKSTWNEISFSYESAWMDTKTHFQKEADSRTECLTYVSINALGKCGTDIV